jgi:hypothetical protein
MKSRADIGRALIGGRITAKQELYSTWGRYSQVVRGLSSRGINKIGNASKHCLNFQSFPTKETWGRGWIVGAGIIDR